MRHSHEQQVLTDWVKDHKIPNALCVTLTEKQFVNGIPLDGIRSDQNFRHFLSLLNRKGNSQAPHGPTGFCQF